MEKECKLCDVAQHICQESGYVSCCFIDSGAFKETYKIQDNEGNIFALKIFKENNSKERTDREVESMQKMNCENIAKLIMVQNVSYGGQDYLYMIEEFFDGGSLGNKLSSSIISIPDVVLLGNDMIVALENTNCQHIVHRDIKPDNIMFRRKSQTAVLVDFGLVRDLDASSLTQDFQMRGPGTALYSAPEQLTNKKEMIDWRTDQFALGITLYQSLTGKHPFWQTSSNDTIEQIASFKVCNAEARKELSDMGMYPIVKMLEPYPINRYRTPKALNDEWNKMGGNLK